MISIILIEPEHSGNVGYVARVMHNFNFTDLVLISPKCSHLDLDGRTFATHGKGILQKAKVKDMAYLRKFDHLIATTAKIGTDYNIRRSPITPEEIAEKISPWSSQKIGILFGRESSGLTNKEIALADVTVTIPASKKYPTLSIAHAAAIVMYCLNNRLAAVKQHSHIPLATRKEKEIIFDILEGIISGLDLKTPSKEETQRRVWQRVIGKSFLTRREAFAVIGFLKKVKGRMR